MEHQDRNTICVIHDLDESNTEMRFLIIVGYIVMLSNLKSVLGEKVGYLLSYSFRLEILEKSSVKVLSISDDKTSDPLKEKE